jgi:hypothetical protein
MSKFPMNWVALALGLALQLGCGDDPYDSDNCKDVRSRYADAELLLQRAEAAGVSDSSTRAALEQLRLDNLECFDKNRDGL